MSVTSERSDVRPTLSIGDIVEVKPAEEILAGLDDRGELDSLPFMPEMLPFCGRRFVVDKIAFKTCDTATWTGLRRLTHTVHLAGLRCDGEAHGGCQAGCLIFWKTAWLTRVSGPTQDRSAPTRLELRLRAPDSSLGDGMAPVTCGACSADATTSLRTTGSACMAAVLSTGSISAGADICVLDAEAEGVSAVVAAASVPTTPTIRPTRPAGC